MCYTAIFVNKNGLGLRGQNTIIDAYEKYAGENPDGYALATDNGLLIRTLDHSEFVRIFNDNSEKIQQAKIVHLHFRAATSNVAEPFVHLWKVGGYYCSHNGVMSELNRNIPSVKWDREKGIWVNEKGEPAKEEPKCDSLEFFKLNEKAISEGAWQDVANSLGSYTGYSIILMSDMENGKVVFGSAGKTIRVVSDGEMVVISSSELDIVEWISVQGLDFFKETHTEYSKSIESKLFCWDIRNETYEEYTVPYRYGYARWVQSKETGRKRKKGKGRDLSIPYYSKDADSLPIGIDEDEYQFYYSNAGKWMP